MKTSIKLLTVLLLSVCSYATTQAQTATTKYKSMIQMVSYEGEKAYVIISLINPSGKYEKTLAVLGPDKQWFNTLLEWHKFQTMRKEKLSAITTASVGGGDRAMRTIEIENAKIDKGYTIRFESAVEEKKYFAQDVEIPLTTAGVVERSSGKGYIRFVKLSKVQ